MEQREFITGSSGAAIAWPCAAVRAAAPDRRSHGGAANDPVLSPPISGLLAARWIAMEREFEERVPLELEIPQLAMPTVLRERRPRAASNLQQSQIGDSKLD